MRSHFKGLERQPDMVYGRKVLDPTEQMLLFTLFSIYHDFFFNFDSLTFFSLFEFDNVTFLEYEWGKSYHTTNNNTKKKKNRRM